MIRPFVPWPDARLRTAAAPVEAVTDEIRTLLDDMVETMDAMPGYGLAAPQIGVMQQVAVVDASDERGRAVRMVNPRLLIASDETRDHDEASPNLPGVSARLTRSAEVRLVFLDETGTEVERTFVGLWATSAQHQLDHLAGKMYFDRLSRTKRAMLLKKAAKWKR